VSEKNIELVRQIYGEWERGNINAGVELFDPEIVFETFMPDSDAGVVANGPAEVEGFMREFLEQWRDYRLIAEELTAAGEDIVLVSGRQAARGKVSGVEVEQPMFSVWIFRANRVIALRFTPFRAEALEAAGLSEQDAHTGS
jgi:ketosteroid isomerase-like protein